MGEQPVLLDLNAIAAEPGARGLFTYSLRLPPIDDLVVEGAVEVALEALNTAQALLVRGNFRGKVHLACARCLEMVVVEVRGEIDEQFSLRGITAPELELIDQVEPREAAIAEQILNVSELVRQQLLVSLPLRVLCRPDCRGICPQCGRNLNQEECQCAQTEGSPAWETLRLLLEKERRAKHH